MNKKIIIGGIAVIVAGIVFAYFHDCCGTIKIKKQGVFAAGGGILRIPENTIISTLQVGVNRKKMGNLIMQTMRL